MTTEKWQDECVGTTSLFGHMDSGSQYAFLKCLLSVWSQYEIMTDSPWAIWTLWNNRAEGGRSFHFPLILQQTKYDKTCLVHFVMKDL